MKFNRRSIFGLAAGAAVAPVVGAPDLRAGIWAPVDASAAGSVATMTLEDFTNSVIGPSLKVLKDLLQRGDPIYDLTEDEE